MRNFVRTGRPLLVAAAVIAVVLSGCEDNGGNSGSGGDHVHTWGGWTVLSPATCDAQGVETRTCTQDANHKETRVISQLTGTGCNSTGGNDSYESVTIGGKKWMKKNLNIQTADSWCYENSTANCDKYGRLYTWAAAKKACPSGWRLPDTADWNKLVNAAGGYSVAGNALKSRSGWNNNGNSTDDFGFSALPSGFRRTDGIFGRAGEGGYWWTATEGLGGNAHSRGMYFSNGYVSEDYGVKSDGYSVRCLKD